MWCWVRKWEWKVNPKCPPSLQEQKVDIAQRKTELLVHKDSARAKRELQLAQSELQCKVSELGKDSEVQISDPK